jgi:hypothetical protein
MSTEKRSDSDAEAEDTVTETLSTSAPPPIITASSESDVPRSQRMPISRCPREFSVLQCPDSVCVCAHPVHRLRAALRGATMLSNCRECECVVDPDAFVRRGAVELAVLPCIRLCVAAADDWLPPRAD